MPHLEPDPELVTLHSRGNATVRVPDAQDRWFLRHADDLIMRMERQLSSGDTNARRSGAVCRRFKSAFTNTVR